MGGPSRSNIATRAHRWRSDLAADGARRPRQRRHARYVPDDVDVEMAEAAEPTLDEAIDWQRALDRLRAAIAALPPHYRDVLVLVELAERSYAEAAAICGCELNTVRSRLSRGRALLARWLGIVPDAATDIARKAAR